MKIIPLIFMACLLHASLLARDQAPSLEDTIQGMLIGSAIGSRLCCLKTYELGYFDIRVAKDIGSALVAGLAWCWEPSWVPFMERMFFRKR